MRVIHGFINGVTRLNDVIGRWISGLIFVIFSLLIFEVSSRYLFGSPNVWTNELAQLLFGLYGVMAGGYVMAHREHVNVDLLHSYLPRRAQAGVDIFTSLVFFIFTLALLYFGGSMAWESIKTMETSYSAWNPPIYPIKAAIPIATFLLLLQGIAKLLGDIIIACNLEPKKDDHAVSSGAPQ